MALEFAYESGQLATRPDVLAVDGLFGVGPNLSHWPGNRTPARYRDDLSTGMALRLARDPEREAFLAGITLVANNHYDTDGLGALFSVLDPATALAVEPLLLAATTAGDFEVVQDWRALAFDEIVLNLAHHPESPVAAAVAGLGDAARREACYRWLLARMERLLRHPEDLEALWIQAWRDFERDWRLIQNGLASVERHPAESLTIIRTPRELGSRALTTAAGACRVLELVTNSAGTLARFFHTTHSWFDLVTQVPRRFALEPLAREFTALERPGSPGQWLHHPLDAPFAELCFAIPSTAGTFPFGGLGELTPTSIDPRRLVDAILAHARASVPRGA